MLNNYIRIRLTVILIASLSFSALLIGQSGLNFTFSEVDIRNFLTDPEITIEEVKEAVERGCVNFSMNSVLTVDFVKLGATAELIDLLHNRNCTLVSDSVSGLIKIDSISNWNVPSSYKVTGTYAQSMNDDIWIFVVPEKASDWGWPQTSIGEKGIPAKKKNGNWEVLCHFGGEDQDYDLVAYRASGSVSETIKDTLVKWDSAKHFPGLLLVDLPAGLTEEYRVTVTKD